VTRPYSHSLSDDQKKYRARDELQDEVEHDPITVLAEQLISMGALTTEDADRIRDEAKEEVRTAAEQALAARRPDPATVTQHVFGPMPVVDDPGEPQHAADAEVVTFGEAIRLTLHEQMARDERIRVFGEDVADADPDVIDEVPGKGGVFGITFGLQRAFGDARCFNTPLAEANIIGRAVGQAARSRLRAYRPIGCGHHARATAQIDRTPSRHPGA